MLLCVAVSVVRPASDLISLYEPITWENIGYMLHRLPNHPQARFALFCAKKVIHLTELKEAHRAIEVAELSLEGKATKEECRIASNAAGAIYNHDTNSALMAAAYYAVEAIEDGTEDQLKAEIIAYLKELVIEELPQDLKENWLLVASL